MTVNKLLLAADRIDATLQEIDLLKRAVAEQGERLQKLS